MQKLIECIKEIRGKLPVLRRKNLNETATRTIIIDALLTALGWNVRDPDEVQLEYVAVDNKFIDYALMVNGKPALLVEAKALADPLTDIKAITQVVGYAANAGIEWCILTNGVTWRVYRSMERCPAPEKLLFEIDLSEESQEVLTPGKIAKKMWRFSQEQIVDGTLDMIGRQTFTDAKVRKALDMILRDPPRKLVNLLREKVTDANLTPRAIKESIVRIWTGGSIPATGTDSPSISPDRQQEEGEQRSRAEGRAWDTRRKGTTYDESHLTEGKPLEILELYRAMDQFCRTLEPIRVKRRFTKYYVGYYVDNSMFCSLHVQRSRLKAWVKLTLKDFHVLPSFARDVSNIGHFGVGDIELDVSSPEQVEEAKRLIQMSFEKQRRS